MGIGVPDHQDAAAAGGRRIVDGHQAVVAIQEDGVLVHLLQVGGEEEAVGHLRFHPAIYQGHGGLDAAVPHFQPVRGHAPIAAARPGGAIEPVIAGHLIGVPGEVRRTLGNLVGAVEEIVPIRGEVVVGAVADLPVFLALLQILPHVDEADGLQLLGGQVVELVIVIRPVEGGQHFLHQVPRGGDHDQVRRHPQLGGKLVELGQVVGEHCLIHGLGGVDEVAAVTVVDVLGRVAAGGQVPVGVDPHVEIPAGDLVCGVLFQVLLGFAGEDALYRHLRRTGQVTLLIGGVVLVRQGEEEHCHHP